MLWVGSSSRRTTATASPQGGNRWRWWDTRARRQKGREDKSRPSRLLALLLHLLSSSVSSIFECFWVSSSSSSFYISKKKKERREKRSIASRTIAGAPSPHLPTLLLYRDTPFRLQSSDLAVSSSFYSSLSFFACTSIADASATINPHPRTTTTSFSHSNPSSFFNCTQKNFSFFLPRLRNSDNRTGELFANSKLSSYFIIWETRRGQEGRVGNRQGRPSRLKLYLCTHSLTDLSLTILLLISWKWISQTLSTTSSLSNVTKANPETFFQNIKWKLNEVKGKKRQNNSFLLLNDTSLKLLPLASSVGLLPFIFYYPSIENDVGFRKPSEGSFLIVTREKWCPERTFFFSKEEKTLERPEESYHELNNGNVTWLRPLPKTMTHTQGWNNKNLFQRLITTRDAY